MPVSRFPVQHVPRSEGVVSSGDVREEVARFYDEYKWLLKGLRRNGLFIPERLANPRVYVCCEDEKSIEDIISQPDDARIEFTARFLKALSEAITLILASPKIQESLRKPLTGENLTPKEIMDVATPIVSELFKHNIYWDKTSTELIASILRELSLRAGREFEVKVRGEQALRLWEDAISYPFFAIAPGKLYLPNYLGFIAGVPYHLRFSLVTLNTQVEAGEPFSLLLGDKVSLFRDNRGGGVFRIKYKGVLPSGQDDIPSDDIALLVYFDKLYSSLVPKWSIKIDTMALGRLLGTGRDNSVSFYSTGTASIFKGEPDWARGFIVDGRFIVDGKRLIRATHTSIMQKGVIDSVTFSTSEEIYSWLVNDMGRLAVITRGETLEGPVVQVRSQSKPLEVLFLPIEKLKVTSYVAFEVPEAVWNPSSIDYARPEYIPLSGEPQVSVKLDWEPVYDNVEAYLFQDTVLVKVKKYYAWSINRRENRLYRGQDALRITGSLTGIIRQRRFKTKRNLKVNIMEELHPILLSNYNVTIPVYLVSDKSRTYTNNEELLNDMYVWKGEPTSITPIPETPVSLTVIEEDEFRVRTVKTRTLRPVIEVSEESVRVRICTSNILPPNPDNSVLVSEASIPVLKMLGISNDSSDGYLISPLKLYSNFSEKTLLQGKVYYGLTGTIFRIAIILDRGTTLLYSIYPENQV